MRKIICILYLFPVLFSSCLTVQKIEKNCDKFAQICITDNAETTEISDTIWITKRDTIIDYQMEKEIVTDTVFIRSNGTYLNSDTSYLTTGLASSEAFIWRSRLFHTLESGDTILNIRLNNALTEINHLRTELTEKTATVKIREDTTFGKFTKKWFIGSLIAIFICISGYLLKKRKVF